MKEENEYWWWIGYQLCHSQKGHSIENQTKAKAEFLVQGGARGVGPKDSSPSPPWIFPKNYSVIKMSRS